MASEVAAVWEQQAVCNAGCSAETSATPRLGQQPVPNQAGFWHSLEALHRGGSRAVHSPGV